MPKNECPECFSFLGECVEICTECKRVRFPKCWKCNASGKVGEKVCDLCEGKGIFSWYLEVNVKTGETKEYINGRLV